MKNSLSFLTANGDDIFLTASIFLATLDYNSLLDYSLRTIIGGAAWFAFKMLGEYLQRKLRERREKRNNQNPEQ
jgi:hypothetical protein